MLRRTFLSTTTIVAVGSLASCTAVATKATTMVTENSAVVKEFSTETKAILNNFISVAEKNLTTHNQNKSLANALGTPVKIVEKNFTDGNHYIIYNNKGGDFITLHYTKDGEVIYVHKEKPDMTKKD